MATKLVVCLVLIAAASAVPLNKRENYEMDSVSDYHCAKQCKDTPINLYYQPSQTYVYEYKTEAETHVAGASEEKAQLHIQAIANIEVISLCEFALRLQNVKVHHSEPHSNSMKPAEQMQEFRRVLSEHTLRFSFDDGVIRDICPSPQEKNWVLNFKRGLLSAFQNSMDDITRTQKVTEVDVSGECPTQYNKTQSWTWRRSKALIKSKDLLACKNHHGLRTVIPMVPYDAPSDIQSLPIMKSSHQCEQVIAKDGVLESTSCKESHIFAPFSNKQSGVVTNIQQKLTYKAVKGSIDSTEGYIEVRSNLKFQHVNGINEIQNSQEAAEQKLKEICEQTKDEVRPETPRLFTELVHIVKNLESSDLRNLYKMIKNKKLCSQNEKALNYLLDTLPVAGTTAAVEMMTFAINNDQIPDLEKHMWLTSLSFITEPSEDMLPSLAKLLFGKFSDESLLPVSALLNTMCEKTVNCERSYQFKKIVKKLTDMIDCKSDDRTQVLKVLKSVGNIGHGQDFLNTLESCLKSHYVHLEVRVASADAYRRFKCQEDEENGPLFSVFKSKDIDSELRIVSFLSLMRCPSDSILKKIAAQLEKEDDVNVGTFVYTHLRNLKQTADPHKQDIADAVKGLSLRTFEDSGLKTSRGFESSVLMNRLNLGYVADADLLWSDSSVFPRAAKVNLTMELFGKSINIFDVGIRADGVEQFVQKYFGTDGYFTDAKVGNKDLEASIYARMFGNELFFQNLAGFKSEFSLEKLMDNLKDNYNYKYAHSKQLFDESLIIPTMIGLPVNLTVNSTVSVDVEATGDIDLNGLFLRSKPIAASTDMAASAGLEVTGSMMVDAHFYKQGLRMRNTLHSSVSFKGSVKVKNLQIVDMQAQAPQKRQDLFDARSQFFIVHGDSEKEQNMIKEHSKDIKGCTGETLSKITGLELCGEFQYPDASINKGSPYFPITGPVAVSIFLDKTDTQRNYRVFAKWIRSSKQIRGQIQIDTPGSKVDRHISVDLGIGMSKNKHVDFDLRSPWKRLMLNGKATLNEDLASLTGSVVIDDTKQYELIAELKRSQEGKHDKFVPFVEIVENSRRFTLLSGFISDKNGLSADLKLRSLSNYTIEVKSEIIFSKTEKRFFISLGEQGKTPYQIDIGTVNKQSGRKAKNFHGSNQVIILTPRGVIVMMRSNYEFQPKPLKLIGNLSLDTIRMRKTLTLKVDIKKERSRYPVTIKFLSDFLTGDVRGTVDERKNSYSSNMRMNYKTSSIKDIIVLSGKLLNRSRNSYTQYNLNSGFKSWNYPQHNTKTKLVFSHKVYPKNVNKQTGLFDLTINYGHKKNIMTTKSKGYFSADVKNVAQAEIKADLTAQVPEKDIDIKMHLDHEHSPRKIDSDVKLHLIPFVENDINAAIYLQNKGASLYAITAKGKLEVAGKEHSLKSHLTQKSKRRIEHTLIVSSVDEDEHKVTTVCKMGKSHYEIKTDIASTQLDQPLSLSASAVVKNPLDMQLTATLKENKEDQYSVNIVSKLDKDNAGNWRYEMVYPQRKVKARASFRKDSKGINVDAMVNWDVESEIEPKPQIDLDGFFKQILKPDSFLSKTTIKLTTPFKNMEKLTYFKTYEQSNSEIKSERKVSWGGIHKQLSTKFSAKLPISIEKTKLSFEAKTPFDSYKDIEIVLDHELDKELATSLIGKVDGNHIIVKGEKDDEHSRIHGDLTLKTAYIPAKKILMDLHHTRKEEKNGVTLKMDKDGKVYQTDVEFYNPTHGEELAKSVSLSLDIPDRKVHSTLKYNTVNGKQLVEASLEASQKNNKVIVDVTGSYHDVNHIYLNVDLKSPLKSFRKAGLEIDHNIEEGEVKSKIILMKNRATAGYDVSLVNMEGRLTVDSRLLLSPAYERDITLTSRVQYEEYPMTVSTKLTWAPSSVVDFSGSFKHETDTNTEISLKLTTPFEDFENIIIIGSRNLKNSVTICRLNIDYDVRKIIDIELSGQNDEDVKMFRLMVKPSHYLKHLDAGINVNTKKGMQTRTHFELISKAEEKYQGVVSLRVNKMDVVRGKMDIKTPHEGFKHFEGSLLMEDGSSNKKSHLTLSNNNEKLVDIVIETEQSDTHVYVKVITEGEILKTLNFAHRRYAAFKQVITDLKVAKKDHTVDVGGSLNMGFENVQNTISFNIHKEGQTFDNFDIDGWIKENKQTAKMRLLFKSENGIQVQATLTDPWDNMFGYIFAHSTGSDTVNIKNEVYFGDLFNNTIEFYVNGVEHIDLTATHKTRHRGYEMTSFKYRHEGQENHMSCSCSVEDKRGIIASIDLVAKSSPTHLISIVMKTPFTDLEKMVIAGDYDESSLKGVVKFNKINIISLSGTHNDFKSLNITLTSAMKYLKRLSVNFDGELMDGSSGFILMFNDKDHIEGKMTVKYENLNQMKTFLSLELIHDEKRHSMTIESDNVEMPTKTSHILLSVNKVNQLQLDTEVEPSGRNHIDLELKYPNLDLESDRLTLNIGGRIEKAAGTIQVHHGIDKLVDLDLTVDLDSETKVSLLMRQPKSMECKFTQDNLADSKENKLYLNWDRTDPDAMLVIQTTLKDDSSHYKADKSISLKLSCPSRSIGIEHAFTATKINVQSSGKLFWNDDRESRVSYDLQMNDLSDRRKNMYDGDLKIELPTRTIGFSASSNDRSRDHQLESTFSWDLDNDKSKKIGLKTVSMKGPETHAEVSLILPQDAHVDSKLVMNKGNTILEGQTQIFYSQNSAKTLTLFSKVENNPGSSSLYSFFNSEDKFNYSIQFGLKHPDSRVDMKVNSHLAMDNDKFTTSVGLDYLSSQREMKNLDLLLEINKLQKEINLYSVTPYRRVKHSGTIINVDPMELKASKTVDGEELKSAHFKVIPDEKKVQLDLTNDGEKINIAAFYPNQSTVHFEVNREENQEVQPLTKVIWRLSTSTVLQTTLHWRPGMTVEFRDRFFDNLEEKTYGFKDFIDEIAHDVNSEFAKKYEDIYSSFNDDIAAILESVIYELNSVQVDVQMMRRSLGNSIDFCNIKVGDFVLNDELTKLQKKLLSVVEDLDTGIESYTSSFKHDVHSVLEELKEMKNYPVDKAYENFLDFISHVEDKIFHSDFIQLAKAIKNTERKTLENAWRFIDEIAQKGLNPRPLIEHWNEEMENLMDFKLSSQIAKLIGNNEKAAAKVTAILIYIKEIVLDTPVTREIAICVGDSFDSVYSHVQWAYDFWNIEEALPLLLDDTATFIHQVIDAEIKEQLGYMHRLMRSPVTKFDPDQGVLQVELPLFVSVDRLNGISNKTQSHQEAIIIDLDDYQPSRNPEYYSLW